MTDRTLTDFQIQILREFGGELPYTDHSSESSRWSAANDALNVLIERGLIKSFAILTTAGRAYLDGLKGEEGLEVRARQIAAKKMGLIKDTTGANLPEDLWKQALPQARREAAVFDPQPALSAEDGEGKTASARLADLDLVGVMLAALQNVQRIITEGASTGFNCEEGGDWPERLYLSQQVTSAAIRRAKTTAPLTLNVTLATAHDGCQDAVLAEREACAKVASAESIKFEAYVVEDREKDPQRALFNRGRCEGARDSATAIRARPLPSSGAPPVASDGWRTMESAPKYTQVLLWVDYREGDHALEDAEKAISIGSWLDDEGWNFAGWSWQSDIYIKGQGKPLAWRPLPSPPGAYRALSINAPVQPGEDR